jgi:hypothetical protein
MRDPLVKIMFVLLVLLTLSPVVMAQGPRKPPPGFVAAGIPEMPTPPGPAPKHDLTGAWVGPIKIVMGPYPEMTDAGKAVMSRNHPVPEAGQRQPGTPEGGVNASNDPFMICDPLGVPRDLLNHAISMRGAIVFQPLANRMLMLFEQQRVWREVWTDGRQLPAKVDAAGAPDSRFYGYSAGHWDGDATFVIDTVGLDPRSWLDERGHPHTKDVKVQERWTRLDQYNLQATVTVEDPKFYTKPFQLMQTNYYWMKDQEFEETLCIPSEGIEYRDKLASPSGWAPGQGPAQ